MASNGCIITKIVVHGEFQIGFGDGHGGKKDLEWEQASVDDGPQRELTVIVRRWLTQGHPLTVYVDGSTPLYPTVVYDESGTLIGFSPGKIGMSQ